MGEAVTYLLALDPGGSTGWSWWEYDDKRQLTHLTHGTVRDGLRGFLEWWEHAEDCEIVIEDFILDGRTPRPDTTPLEILGAVEFAAKQDGVKVTRQRNYMKNHAPDELLKERGLWWPGKGHDRDSARHAIAYMKTMRHLPTLEWLYGKA